ncbi:lysylphosphatidylglycerol synthase transmembrane domain-containing protein [Streptomyces sp. 7N604]|uniref:lysylphosphatidylglycerol synthase transmembrane domain-containing protein n=1 Tax=Streptomyces sp. 7N604 TaxID=3457415 RepID=UPI003FD10B59
MIRDQKETAGQQSAGPPEGAGTSDESSRPDAGRTGRTAPRHDKKARPDSADQDHRGPQESQDHRAHQDADQDPHEDTRQDTARPNRKRADRARADRARAGKARSERPERTPPRPAGGAAGGDGDDEGEVHVDQVSGDEPLLPARVHRPADLVRVLLGILGIIVVLGIAAFAHGTTEGLKQDIGKGTGQAPDLLTSVAGFASSVAILIVPVAFAIERLIKRDGLRIADGVLAAVLAHGVSLATDLWVARSAPDSIQEALTKQAPSGDITDPVHGYLAPVIAYMTAVGMARRPRWRVLLWVVLALQVFAVLLGGFATPFSILVTVLIGWTVAYGTLYTVGSPNVRPTGRNLLTGLRRVGFKPVSALRAEEPPDADNQERGRRYIVTLEDGPPLDVTVVDREQQAQGFFYRVWRRFALRGITQRRSLQSLRQALEQEALLAYAAIAAGANAPKLIATSELGPDAVMLVYEHTGGRTLDSLPDEAITDELLRSTWRQVQALQSRRIAHRRLVGDAILVDRSGNVALTDLRGGEIAAGDLVLRMDIAQLLTTLGLRVGAERSVAAAVGVLGPDAVADSLPLLQPIALSRSTRSTLRHLAKERAQREREAVLAASHAAREALEAEQDEHGDADTTEGGKTEGGRADRKDRKPTRAERKSVRAERIAEKRAIEEAIEEAREEDLLAQIRQQILLIRPQAPVEPARLERIRPRTLVSIIAGAIAAYFLLSTLTHVSFKDVIAEANWYWVAAALAFAALTYVAATFTLLGFVPEKVSFVRTMLAQVAGSFVKLVAPAAVGGVALNARFLQRSGVRPGLAVASVGASQLVGLGMHIVLLMVFGYITGTERTPSLTPSRTVIAGLLTAAVLALIVTAVPALRKFLSTRVRSLFAGVVPRMLDIMQRPQKLLTGLGGTLLLTGAFVMCLDASIRAFGGELSYASIAVVFLAGNALGSAAPTPGGVGAVEATLTFGLIAAGLPKEIATPAVLLFRLMTFWLPVLPGWLSFTHLTRREAI